MNKERLDELTKKSIQQGLNNRRRKKQRELMSISVICLMFISTLATNESFARQVSDLPIIGHVANIFLKQEVREYGEEYQIDVNIPQLQSLNQSLDDKVNQYILNYINEEVENVKKTAQSEYQSFINLGGKKEDFIPGNVTIRYRVTCNNEHYLSFFLMSSTVRASSYTKMHSYTIDLKSGKELSLEKIYGKDYQKLISQEIDKQIKELQIDTFNVNIEDFIDENRPFYLNEKGDVVVMFEKYEIAAGSYGELSFVMPKGI